MKFYRHFGAIYCRSNGANSVLVSVQLLKPFLFTVFIVSIYKSSYLASLTGVGMSNGRNANHVTLPCQPYADHSALRPHSTIFGRRYSARSAIRLAICAGSQPQRGSNKGLKRGYGRLDVS